MFFHQQYQQLSIIEAKVVGKYFYATIFATRQTIFCKAQDKEELICWSEFVHYFHSALLFFLSLHLHFHNCFDFGCMLLFNNCFTGECLLYKINFVSEWRENKSSG